MPLMVVRGSGYGRERLGPFSLENVTAVLSFISGVPGCHHATQNPQNPQNLLPGEVLNRPGFTGGSGP
jgi:hypothetical protein